MGTSKTLLIQRMGIASVDRNQEDWFDPVIPQLVAMATVAAASCASAATCFVQKSVSSKQISGRAAGLPALRMSKVTCSAERKERKAVLSAATVAASVSAALPSLAAVEEILGGDGTGLPLGLNDASLTWVLLGVFTTIWGAFYLYASSLPKTDDDSGLGL
ncbi:unnamed protein product [Closterium sp. Yama58-4]|nr:unnamed protein product [Closterium sp. Yama58-4]